MGIIYDLCEKGARTPEDVSGVLQAIINEDEIEIIPLDWKDRIIAREQRAHRSFFGDKVFSGFDYSEFRKAIEEYGEVQIKEWRKLGLGVHYLPEVEMAQDTKFLGWEIKPRDWYYEKVVEGRILRQQPDGHLKPDNQVRLGGIVVLIDTRCKPAYDEGKQMYENDSLLGSIIEGLREQGKIADYEYGPKSSRFGISADEWEEYIKSALAKSLGLKDGQVVRLETTIEMNVIPQIYKHMPRAGDGETNTWVLLEENFEGRHDRLSGGVSSRGGLSNVFYYYSDDHWGSGSVRPLAVL